MASFVPCPRCHRHVRSTETACVFCGVARASQAAVLLSAAALAFGGCDPKPAAEVPTPPAASASAPVPSADPAPSSAAVTPSATAPAVAASVAPATSVVGAQEPPVRPAMRYGIAPRK
ncbi:MAG TPA: hypothetical protein PK141_28340 [Polyangiaceae bacterium]|nr:hypothetical protein [Polyangiaceae bacterium]